MDDLESQKKDAIGREDYVEANALKQEIEKLQAASQDLFWQIQQPSSFLDTICGDWVRLLYE